MLASDGTQVFLDVITAGKAIILGHFWLDIVQYYEQIKYFCVKNVSCSSCCKLDSLQPFTMADPKMPCPR